jgi:Fe-S cluster assembly scaffold protein SufB
VPADVQLNTPIRVTRWLSEAGVAQFGRVLILAENASRISYVD